MAQLGRLDRTVQDTSGNAVSGASVTMYREGATVDGNQSGTSPLTVTVRHRGKIVAADTVFTNTTTGTTYSVNSVTATTVVISGFAGTLALTGGDRITPSNNQPTLYSDDQGGATTSNPLTTSSTGRANCWMEFGAYDIIASGSGITTTAYTAQITPSQDTGQIRYADEFQYGSSTGGIQEAINDLPSSGGIVQLSANTTYTISAAIDLEQKIWLRGAGPSTVISPSSTFPADVAGEADGLIRTPNVAGAPKYNLASPGDYNVISDLRLNILWSTLARPVYAGIQLFGIRDVMIRNVICEDGERFGINIEHARRVTVEGCHVRKFPDDVNSNGISVAGDGTTPTAGTNYVIVGNVVEDIGTIGIDLQATESAVISGNVLRSCRYGIALEGNNAASAGGPIRNITVSNNTLIGTTDTNEIGTTQDKIAIILWLRATSGSPNTDTEHYNLTMVGNTIKDYDVALAAAGGHWLFSNNNIYNYGNGGASTNGIVVGTVFATSLKMSNIAIVDNYFQQTTRAASGTVAAININNGTVGVINNVVIRGNVINGQDLAAGGSTQHGIFIQTIGSNWDISGNYFRNVTDFPIRVLTNNTVGATPSNWRIADNLMIDCNFKTGGSTSNYIVLGDANNFTWSKIAILRNVAFDANGRMSNLISNSGTGWTGALTIQDNFAPDVSVGLTSLVAAADVRHGVTQNITAAATAIVALDRTVKLTADASYTLTAAPTIANGFNGQLLRIVNIDTADVITLQDQGGLANSNLRLGAATRALGPRDSIELLYDSTIGDWIELWFSNVT